MLYLVSCCFEETRESESQLRHQVMTMKLHCCSVIWDSALEALFESLGRDIEEKQEVSTSAFELTANDCEKFSPP